jgi:hypothetical protein
MWPTVARKLLGSYLGWFSELGIVTRHGGHPATYECNDAYFEWQRINQLAADHSVESLQQSVRELSSRIEAYEDTYGAPTPAAVDAVAAAESSDDQTRDRPTIATCFGSSSTKLKTG